MRTLRHWLNQRVCSDHRFLGRYRVALVAGLRLRRLGLLPVSRLCSALPFAVFLLRDANLGRIFALL